MNVNKIQQRLEALNATSLEDDGGRIEAASITCLRDLLRAYPDLRRPSLVLTPTHNVRGSWGGPKTPYVGVEFLPSGELSVVHSVGKGRGVRVMSIDAFRAHIAFVNATGEVFKNDK